MDGWKAKKRDGPGGVGLLLAEGGGSGFQIRPTFLTFQAGLVTPLHQTSNSFSPDRLTTDATMPEP